MKYFALGIPIALTTLALTQAAQANCAMPTGYSVKAEGNTVTVCPQNFDGRGCPDSGGMLRETTGGDAVQLAENCKGDCYVDECVPKGEHKYGFATPYECCSSCCGTDFYDKVTIADDPPSGCTLSSGNPGTTPFSGTVPWTDTQSICDYIGGSGATGSGGSVGVAGSAGSAGNGAASGSAGSSSSPSGDDGGCAVRPMTATSKVVLGFNAMLAALGLLLTARRRRRRA
ncbi:MAG TPA: MYXO-CTERM sorting domain-containing protein [Polyangiaceae bacterium]|nr:MYXO-CTERM sorting domain-containing protein [Polyangiaceae bacterium]HMR73709.1 MYXO-CTERM sorting domain-containing protein [Polyangiaceae bacterium]